MDYRVNEGSFVVPEDWRDESMNIFKGPDSEGYNLVISRERIPRSVDPEQHLAGRRTLIEENLPNYRERERGTIILGGHSCVWLEYTWRSPEGSMSQVNVMRAIGRTMVSFTYTSARAFTEGQRALFRQVLESYQLHAQADVAQP